MKTALLGSVKNKFFFFFLITLSASSGLVAKSYSSLPMYKASSDDPTATQDSSNGTCIRAITDDEFNGTNSITLPLNQQLLVPAIYHHSLDNNVHTFACGVDDPTILSNEEISSGSDFSTMGLTDLFIPLAVGQTKITYLYDNKIVKELNVNITKAE